MPEAWELTDEQRAAVEVDGPALVRAGAGSGKTAALAHRFLRLLRPLPEGSPGGGAEVSQILAITFTEKAAAEMKRKIREVLAAELARATAATRPHWERVRRDLFGAQISTIHAFCARVLRENPLEAGIDPGAAVLDEHESRAYVEAVVEAELLARLRSGEAAAHALVLRHRLAGGRDGGAVALLTDFLGWLGRTGHDAAWLAAAAARQAARAPEAVQAMREAAERVVRTVDARCARGRDTALAAAWPHWAAVLRRLGADTPLEDFLALGGLCRLLKDARCASEIGEDLECQDGRLRGRLAAEYGFLAALPENARLATLVGAIAEAVRARKRADGVLTFDDLVTETRALLATHPAVRERYSRRFRAILVDEFQDTDRVQADVVRLLAAGSTAPCLFVVGDEKQSIYRFRGADVAVFHRMRAELGRELALGTNFRSLPSILDFVNALAAAILQVPPGGDPTHWTEFDEGQRLVARRAAAGSEPAVRLVTFVAEHARRRLSTAETHELEARALAGVVARLHAEEGVAYGGIAVLFRALTEVKIYENALRRREIPYYVVKGRGFFQCQEVSDVMSLLAALVDPEDGVALAAALRSPLFGLDDDTLWRLAWPEGAERPALTRRFRRRETFADLPAQAPALARVRDLLLRLRALRGRATIAELLEEVCLATDFEAVCLTQFQGAQKVANVRKLIELARDWERRRFFTLRDFVRSVRRLAAHEPREAEAPLVGQEDDVVRLMTIHQAKGLEFPVVLVPDLGRPLPPARRSTVLDDELGLVAPPADDVGRVRLAHAGLERHREREEERQRAEHARLLYVACTRARDLLVLLEGKGDERYLREGSGARHLWCHQVWDLLGRERILEFARGAAPHVTLALPGGGAVRLDRAGAYLGEAEPPAAAEARTAPAGEAERAAVARVLDFRPPAPAEVVTSPTALADFRRCPRQYWFRHVLGLPERGAGGLRATLLGTAAHGVLEALDPEAAPEEEIARQLEARPEALVLRRDELDALAADLGRAAAALRSDVASGLEIIGREVPFVLPLPAREPRLFLHGRLDLLGRRGTTHVVRDYKYVRPSPAAVENHGSQLAAYRLAVLGAGATRVDAELVFLRGGTSVRPLPPLDRAAEERALVRAGETLGVALASGGAEAFPRGPEEPARCTALGCGHVRRCWGAATPPHS